MHTWVTLKPGYFLLTRRQFGEATPHRRTELNLEAKFLELRKIHVLPIKIDLISKKSPGFSKDMVSFPPTSWYGSVFGILDENNIGNTLMFQIVAEQCLH